MNTVKSLSEYLYRELGVINPERIAYYKTSILSHDNVQMLTYNFKSYSLSYSHDLMLSIPELWVDMNPDDWYKLGVNLSPRPEIGEFMWLINSAHYFDIIFLEKYLGIDIDAFISKLAVANDDKNKIHCFRREYHLSFKREETHLEDLNFFYNLDESIFVSTREKLVTAGMSARSG